MGPQWIRQFMTEGCLNLSTDMAMHRARQFLREMAQPVPASLNVSLSLEQLERNPCYVSCERQPAACPLPSIHFKRSSPLGMHHRKMFQRLKQTNRQPWKWIPWSPWRSLCRKNRSSSEKACQV